MRAGCLPPRVHLLGAPLGGSLPRTPGLTAGPYKIVLADSGLPAFAELLELITAAHGSGRPVAAHCVTREALVLLIAALRETGTRAGDRIEHAAVVPPELIPDLAGLHLRVVTQPGFLTGRGDDFLRDVPAADQGDLYRGASLRRAGIPLALSSDAPYGPLDPWAVIAAAVSRRTAAGRTVTPGEQLTGAEALDAYLAPPQDPGGPPARVRAGEPASLVVLDVPAAGLPGDPGRVRAVVAGTGLRRPH